MNGMKRLASLIMVVSVAMGSSAAFADATPLDDGFTEEEWERVPFAPCSGGSSVRRLKTSGDYVHIFNDISGTFRAPADYSVTIHYLLVGGGGGGGSCDGGGGGGGGVEYGTLDIPAGGEMAVTVGNGGLGGILSSSQYKLLYDPAEVIEGSTLTGPSAGTAESGGNSSLIINGDTVAIAYGGGGGGCYEQAGVQVNERAGKGGSGNGKNRGYGGSGYADYAVTPAPVTGEAGKGGDGCSTYIAGEEMCLAGGGGGGGRSATDLGGAGGLGGGGAGTGYNADGGIAGHCGKKNTGGGGGGGAAKDGTPYLAGGVGGRGVVIIRYSFHEVLPSMVNWCIDRTVEGDIIVGEFEPVDEEDISIADGAPAVGGDEVTKFYDFNYVHQFNKSGVFVAPPAEDIVVDYLVIGGGGGGGCQHSGGGGGAGGVRYGRFVLAAGAAVSVTVGHGGAATGSAAGNGEDSSIAVNEWSMVAHGGGAGGQYLARAGKPGGSGGGNWGMSVDFEEGCCGGRSSNFAANNSGYLAGGGGAGRMGHPDGSGVGGAGGEGIKCAITGLEKWYAGGGGAGLPAKASGTGGAGGSGVGGSGCTKSADATLPMANTGSGGGGGGRVWDVSSGASAGADGVVIFRYYSESKPVESGSQFDISQGIDVVDPLENCRGETFDNRAHGGEWTRLANGDFLHAFTNLEAAMKFTAPTGGVSSIRYLIVAGGGSAGSFHGGGGGGGGGVLAGYYPATSGGKVWLSVGHGGAATASAHGNNGTNTTLEGDGQSFTAIGGGGGGAWDKGGGSNGGSGGGCSGNSAAVGKGTPGQGCDGGSQTKQGPGGGGGGACEAGHPDENGFCGSGGDGYNSTITGVSGLYYSGGGGAGYHSGKVSLKLGTGGKGSRSNPNADGTFYGGGSSCNGADVTTADKGGDGVVYIRYASAVSTDEIPCGTSGSDFVDFSTMEMPELPKVVWKRKFAPSKTFEPKLDLALPDGFPLVEGEDYVVEYADNTVIANAAGGMDADQIATMTIRGINGHKGERVLSFKIAPLKATMMIIR